MDRPAVDKLLRWTADPVAFVRENFGVEPDAWQADALMAYGDQTTPRISLQACAGPGKSAVLAWCGWHFLACYGDVGEHPKGFCTAITADNLKANLWPEFAKWQARSTYLAGAFTWTSERIYANDHKATWFLEARTWPKTASAEEQGKTLSGLHGDYVIALVDESGGIPVTVARAAEQALSTRPRFGKIIQAGNPLSRVGMLGEASASEQWKVFRITGDPDDQKRSPRIDIEWARAEIKRHGREDPWVKVYILGLFPPSALNSLLGPDDVRAAMARTVKEGDIAHAPRILGVDVGREGDDPSVVFPRQGMMAHMPRMMRNWDGVQGAGYVAQKIQDFDVDATFIDNTGGFGGSWIDQLRALGRHPIGIHFAGKANDPRYYNKRAEMWFLMAQWVKEGGCLPDVPELIAELSEPTYFFHRDRLQIEDKDQVKARLHRSPNYADALALTFAAPVHRPTALERAGRRQNTRDYNPLDALDRVRRPGNYNPLERR